MHRHKLRLAAGLLTFFVGTSLAGSLRSAPSCYCANVRCRLAFVIDHPSTFLLHPHETVELLWDSHWRE